MSRERLRSQSEQGSKCCRSVPYLATLMGIPSSLSVHIQGLVTLTDRDASIQPRRGNDWWFLWNWNSAACEVCTAPLQRPYWTITKLKDIEVLCKLCTYARSKQLFPAWLWFFLTTRGRKEAARNNSRKRARDKWREGEEALKVSIPGRKEGRCEMEKEGIMHHACI